MNSDWNPDIGGGRGYSISFTDQDSYASVQNYFTPSNHWAVNDMTWSVWLRWVGVSPNGIASYPLTVIAANDPNHILLSLNIGQLENNWVPNLELFTTGVPLFVKLLDACYNDI